MVSVKEYIDSIGLVGVDSPDKLCDSIFEKISDKKLAERIWTGINGGVSDRLGRLRFNTLKNTTLESAIAVVGSFDYEYYQKALGWMLEHLDAFSGDVLEIGCDIGIGACFLAKAAPECRITAVDICDNSILRAKELAKKLGIENVEFVSGNIEQFRSKTFNTIYSMKTIHELAKDVRLEAGITDIEAAKRHAKSLDKYSKTVSRLLRDGGTFLSVERKYNVAVSLGWMTALAQQGVGTVSGGLANFEYYERGRYQQLFSLEARKGQSLSFADGLRLYRNLDDLVNRVSNNNERSFTNEEAFILYSACGAIEHGLDMFEPNGWRWGRFVILSDKVANKNLYYETYFDQYGGPLFFAELYDENDSSIYRQRIIEVESSSDEMGLKPKRL